ncbi:hypothetical protein HS088_TW07G01327 [Tripterygium wilfordii]|uniref:DYW domain-containing protein n=1 Tax=Tripterygium wilfordii TaxID=458696 RepID=A0A7J7DH83_TRIWF|nr:pentatricopeptide repeat-containing protein At4g21065-like [Tripterygium wilfordii]XP_038705805.1 pentatricopeptide repeat-containing protein At4g21065-like [Tripterygium wilfordii]KAF5745735.1 hypothetical protein HS088_TW07G01327 [Tripterygium wilfordii]
MEISTMSQALQLHAKILKTPDNTPDQNYQKGLFKLFTFTALSPSGDLKYAHSILNSLRYPSSYYYNTMIRAYSQSPDPTIAFSIFLSMLHDPTSTFPRPNNFTFPFLLKSCARSRLIRLGKQVHGQAIKSGFGTDLYIKNSLIHMYSGCGESGHACKVFDKMGERDVVSWTAMIDGLVDNDQPVKAIELFERMLIDGLEINDATIVSVLRACADSGALSMGKRVHGLVEERNVALKANVSTILIDMYAKCGCIDNARQVFDDIVDKDVFSWTAMISGLASHGECKGAIGLFKEMVEKFNVKPDERTMTAVLSACRNSGMVNEGFQYFRTMRKKYGLKPTIQHYGCVVDLLARAGRLKEAEDFIRKMPIQPDVVLWRNLIWSCKVHGDTERGERLIKEFELLKSGDSDCGSYVLAGNVYASAGKWDDKARVRELMRQKGLIKPPGSSKIEVDGLIHEFIFGDSNHPDAKMIYLKLDEVKEGLREEGYLPKVSEVLLEMDAEEKSFQLWHHSEKLAVAFGLIKTSPGSEIRIVKNLRSCEDCHDVMKLISKKYQREIIVRDRIRFHHFRNGCCSCGDYW